MNIRQAILLAADHIEQHPAAFNFRSIYVPKSDCGTPGCALGWIGYFYGCVDKPRQAYDGRTNVSYVASETVQIEPSEFYDRMTEALGYTWTESSELCARGLRLYADKYHPAESRALIPESVARIFRMSHAELTRELA
jgi:hypothetical protein